ncbi:nitrile hydratase accessory protein [Mycolicibacterium sp. CBMA 226]|uniref:nitrile hydratase accessory protein n=1 Tax=Mycolicibacterium sp. CBMA 226 TaxID=2606611 RepID=UPI00130CFFF0|nr:nitrile hydratase accessory protein [Mycolicibacterium sp. CBMA 226]MUL79877.1 nitrile hydratase accessory protein [Mycolicibacterium sp. CBMA 226]
MTAAPERPFDAPWQARAFALAVSLQDSGLFSGAQWTATLAAEIAADPERPYYDAWLAALERLAVQTGAVTVMEVADSQAAWISAAAKTPHGEPITLDATH